MIITEKIKIMNKKSKSNRIESNFMKFIEVGPRVRFLTKREFFDSKTDPLFGPLLTPPKGGQKGPKKTPQKGPQK